MAASKKAKAPPPPKKCQAEECEEGLPPWLATFADLATNMLCFFVLLLSFANQDIQKFKDMMGSIKEAFGVQTKRPVAEFSAFSPTNLERKEVEMNKDDKAMLGLVMQIKSLIDESELKITSKITTEDIGVVMRLENDAFFEPGTAKLTAQGMEAVDKVVIVMRKQNYDLVIRSHTDDSPPQGGLYPSNWELTAARAATVLRLLMERGELHSTRMKAVGYADSMPLVPNTTAQHRAQNRRMEFFFHRPGVRSW